MHCASIVLCLIAFVPQDKAEAARLKAAHEQASLCLGATMKKDYEKLADLTHPKIIEAAGGREKMIKQIKEVMSQMESQGLKFEEIKVGETKKIVKGGSDFYCVLPTTTRITFKGSKVTSQAFFVGVSRDDGKTWKFIDGSSGEEALRKLIPEIPKSLELPAKQEPTVEK